MLLTKTDNCFVCGHDNRQGLQAKFQSNRDLHCSFGWVLIDDTFQGWGQIVHGGVIAALLDEACVYAAMSLGGEVVTAELNTRYCHPVPCGINITLFGEVLKYRKKFVLARSRLVAGGVVYAEAEAKLFSYSHALTEFIEEGD